MSETQTAEMPLTGPGTGPATGIPNRADRGDVVGTRHRKEAEDLYFRLETSDHSDTYRQHGIGLIEAAIKVAYRQGVGDGAGTARADFAAEGKAAEAEVRELRARLADVEQAAKLDRDLVHLLAKQLERATRPMLKLPELDLNVVAREFVAEQGQPLSSSSGEETTIAKTLEEMCFVQTEQVAALQRIEGKLDTQGYVYHPSALGGRGKVRAKTLEEMGVQKAREAESSASEPLAFGHHWMDPGLFDILIGEHGVGHDETLAQWLPLLRAYERADGANCTPCAEIARILDEARSPGDLAGRTGRTSRMLGFAAATTRKGVRVMICTWKRGRAVEEYKSTMERLGADLSLVGFAYCPSGEEAELPSSVHGVDGVIYVDHGLIGAPYFWKLLRIASMRRDYAHGRLADEGGQG